MTRNRTLEQYLFLSLILVFFFWMIIGILKPIALGLFLALVLYPAQRYLMEGPLAPSKGPRGRISSQNLNYRPFVALFIVVMFVALVVLPLTYIGIVVAEDATTLSNYLQTLSKPAEGVGESELSLQLLIERAHNYVSAFVSIPLDSFQSSIQKLASQIGSFFGGWLTAVASSVPRTLMDLTIFVLSLYFALADGPKLVALIKAILPFEKAEVETFAATTDSICRGVVVGSLLSGLTQGLIIGISYWVLGVPRPLFFGVMTAVLSFIPFLGSFPAGVGGAIYLFSIDRKGAALALLICFGVASISDNIVKPLALKGQLEIHPMLAFMSVIGGLSLFGFAGLFLGPLVAALAIVILKMLSVRNPSDQPADFGMLKSRS